MISSQRDSSHGYLTRYNTVSNKTHKSWIYISEISYKMMFVINCLSIEFGSMIGNYSYSAGFEK